MKVRVKGVDLNDLIEKKFKQNEALYKAYIFQPQANTQVDIDIFNKEGVACSLFLGQGTKLIWSSTKSTKFF